MDRADFIRRIISLYPHAIKDVNTQYGMYQRALKKSLNIDYEKLMDTYAQEYKDNFPPAPGVLAEMARRCANIGTKTESKWCHVVVYNPMFKTVTNTDCFPAGTSEEAILRAYNKVYPSKEWKIIKIV